MKETLEEQSYKIIDSLFKIKQQIKLKFTAKVTGNLCEAKKCCKT
jgi:hypothetical protein